MKLETNKESEQEGDETKTTNRGTKKQETRDKYREWIRNRVVERVTQDGMVETENKHNGEENRERQK